MRESVTIGGEPIVPMSFTGLGALGSLTFADVSGTRVDNLVIHGSNSSDQFTVDTLGEITSTRFDTFGDVIVAIVPINTPGVTALNLGGLAGDDTFDVPGNHPFVGGLSVDGGDPSASDTLNFFGSGGAVAAFPYFPAINEGANQYVTWEGIEQVNIAAGAGSISVFSPGTDHNYDVTPTAVGVGTFTDSASPNTNFLYSTGGTVTFFGGGGFDGLNLHGDDGPNAITLTATTATVDGAAVTLGAGLDGVDVLGEGGDNTLTVDSTAGPVTVPITYDGGTGNNSLTLQGGTALSDTYTPGPGPGAGVSQLVFAGGTETVYFQNLAPVLDLVAGPLVVNGTPADNAINYTQGSVAANGLVTIDNFESIEFSNKTALTINGLAGSDEINLNNPTTPTGLTGITVNGGDPTASDTLIVNGTPAADTIDFAPTAADAGSVTVNAQPIINFSTIESVVINGQGGNDALTYTTSGAAATFLTFTPGDTANSGSIAARITGPVGGGSGALLVPMSYTNIDQAGSLTFAHSGGGRLDTLILDGTAGNDIFDVTPTNLTLSQAGNPNEISRSLLSMATPGIANLTLAGLGGDDTFNLTGTLPYTTTFIDGSGAFDPPTVNLTGNGTPITVNFGAAQFSATEATVSGGGLGTVTVFGVGVVNIFNGAGLVNVAGVPFTPENYVVTPVSIAFEVQDMNPDPVFSLSPIFNIDGTLAIIGDADAADGDILTVDGTGVNDVITVTNTQILVAGTPAINYTAANLAGLRISGLEGDDKVTIDSTAGPVTVPITYDGGTGNNSLTLQGGTASSDTYTPGPGPGAGVSQLVFATGTETVYFQNLAPVLDLVAGPLVVNGTPADNAINYTQGSVAANGLVTIDNFESIEFSNKTALTINGLAGSDEINLNNPTTPTGLTTINANGGDPTGSDTVIVNGTTGFDVVDFDQFTLDGARVTGLGPTINVAGAERLSYSGQGGWDRLTVDMDGNAFAYMINFYTGATENDASMRMFAGDQNDLLPFDYTGVGPIGQITFADALKRIRLNVYGTDGRDRFAPGFAGGMQIYDAAVGTFRTIQINTPGVGFLSMIGLEGDDVFEINNGLPLAPVGSPIFIDGGDPSGSDVVNFTANAGATTTVDLGASTITSTGASPVSFSGIEQLNLNANGGALTILGTSGPDSLVYTPTDVSAGTVVDNDAAPTIAFTNATGTFTIDGGAGVNQVTVNGTAGDDTITAAPSGTNTTVQVNGSRRLPCPMQIPRRWSWTGAWATTT